MEVENLKQRFANKINIEREKILEDNNRLLEESGNIDYQVELFKMQLLDSQADQHKEELERENKR